MSDDENLPAEKKNYPEQVREALAKLNPKQASAVRAYSQRGSRAYGNKSEACRVAGYSEKTNPYDVFNSDKVQNALRAVREAQLDKASEVMAEIEALAPESKDELQSQLDLGRELGIIDPRNIFGDELEMVSGKDDQARLKEINKHNRVVAHLAKERRQAAELILAYTEGTPEQRMKVTREPDRSDLERMLDDLSPEEFEDLRQFLFGEDDLDDELEPEGARAQAQKEKAPKGGEPSGAVEADYEIVD